MEFEQIKNAVRSIKDDYPVKRVVLFGSRAEGVNRENSDVDLIMEFYAPVTLITLCDIKYRLQDILQLEVDVLHGPIRDTDMIEVGKEIELYAA